MQVVDTQDRGRDLNDKEKQMQMGCDSSNMPQYYLSIIIPAYNEEMRIVSTINSIISFVEAQPFKTEVLVVDNGSTDRTGDIVSEISVKYPYVKCLHEPVRGKGAAVKNGVLSAKGEYILLCDADMAVPVNNVSKFLPQTEGIFDIVIGSREATGSTRYNEPVFRHIIGRIFNFMVQLFVLPGVKDTQCGFKLFRHEVACDLFKSSTINGWSFDVEVLYIARLRGYDIIEAPVDWYYGKFSRINVFCDSFHMLKEIFKIRLNALRGVYS